jgi:putative heme-binding domain-containing protein
MVGEQSMIRVPAAVLLLLAVPALAVAQRDLKDIPDPDPEQERRALQLADGFEINLFAADPLLAKPIQMNFDAAGRLWVACSEVYPQIKPGQQANDRIIILEDTAGVGRADKTTVFADGLLIPTGVEPGDGGAYVADSTDLVHIAADPRTGKGGRRRIVLSGFGTEDTHHILHTLRWGPEGLLYFQQSIYIHSHIETPHGVRRLNAGGIWQFRPETMELDVFARGWWNPWGHAFDRWGQSFVTDGAGDKGVNYVIPRGSYETAAGASRVFPGLNPGSPKYCGHEILSGRHLPEEWRGNLITNDFRGHRVCRFVLQEDGSGFAAVQQADLIRTNHAAFRPVDVKMGPDGAIYIADWYNPIIQHGEVDFRDPRRDHVHGRIWRVTCKGRPLVRRPRLANASTEDVLDALKAPEGWTRHFAKRVLKERGKSVLPTLAAWLPKLDPDDPDREHHLLEALWVYQALDTPEPNLLRMVLQARDPHARAAATRVLSYWHQRLPDAESLLAARVADEHPRVRLEAVRALGLLPDAHAVEVALGALDRPMDRFLDYGLWLTVRDLEPHWQPALQRGALKLTQRPAHLLFALQAAGSRAPLQPVVELVRSGKVPPEHEGDVLGLLASLGGPAELDLVFDRALAFGAGQSGQQAALLVALAEAARQRHVKPTRGLDRLAAVLSGDSDQARAAAADLVGAWKVEPLRPRLADLARTAATTSAVRRAAVQGLAALGGPASREALVQLIGADLPVETRRLAVAALTRIDLRAAALRAPDVLAAARVADDSTEVFSAFVGRSGGVEALTAALAGKKLPADVAKVGVRVARSSGRNHPGLIDALMKAGGLATGPRTPTAEEIRGLVADVHKYGDPARGERVYRRSDSTCLKCHAIAGAGGQVGPDLASIGASAQVDYLIESILLPNKAIKENYHTLVVTTLDGQLFTGIKVRESKTDLVLRNADDREVEIPVKEIESRSQGASLMPEGLADGLTRSELLDLVRFLSELGKVGPYAISKARLVRRWQVVEPTLEARALLAQGPAAAAGSSRALVWSSAYSTVSGVLPLEDLPRLDGPRGSGMLGIARCQLDVGTGGKARLILNSPEGLSLWVDGVPVEVKEQMELDLKSGRRTLTIAVDLARRRDGLRCEVEEVPGSPARVTPVSGK